MNIYDIAELAGVSIATVSRVVNGSDKVSDKTRAKVLKIIEESGFTPNAFAQGLGLNTMHTIGILVPDISDLYMSNAVSNLEKLLHENGYDCLLSCSGFDLEGKTKHVSMLLSKHIDALILVGSTYAGNGKDDEEISYIKDAAKQVPVFLINGLVEGKQIYSTVCDDRNAVYEVTRALIQRGKKRILFLNNSKSYSAIQKITGYEQALKEANLPILGELKVQVKNDIHEVRDLLLQYKTLEFDSIIATEDKIAIGAIKYAHRKGISIPEELSIVGYNNSSYAISCEPELTSVDSRIDKLCQETVQRMLKVVGNPDALVPQHVVIPSDLVKRSTTDF